MLSPKKHSAKVSKCIFFLHLFGKNKIERILPLKKQQKTGYWHVQVKRYKFVRCFPTEFLNPIQSPLNRPNMCIVV